MNMDTIYLTPKKYDSIKAIESFPNPNVKIGLYKNKLCRLEKTCKIVITKVKNQEEALWHNISLASFIGKAENGFFPRNLIAGIEQKQYSKNTKLAKQTGWQNSTNLGSASDAFLNLELVVKILKANNFNVQIAI